MARANTAYYARHDPFADFTTAPEISQAFGEILGAWATVVWRSMGRPDPVILAEAGPGRGTLMADALRLVARLAPDFAAALRLHLVETSPRLRAVQARSLAAHAAPVWHETIEALPDGPLILLANEFLDALPIRQFVRVAAGWCERHVSPRGFELLACAEPPLPRGRLDLVPDGGVIEVCAPALQLTARLCGRLSRQGGAALFLDYGPGVAGHGDTLQALRDGAPTDPRHAPGEADLTAHVDFPALLGVAGDAAAYGPLPQGRFLSSLGLFARIERLAQAQPPVQAGGLVEAAHRLVDPARMGSLFKAIAFCHPALPVPPGFA
ncbi:class I SAM-dependent methyltransferase [Lichenicoccus sp.]|uniref:class I SAM-dependent methyltransferase n=1 Tax=Lichenicoccus sp. TaxID=2781899 RepID=UPI003D0A7C07